MWLTSVSWVGILGIFMPNSLLRTVVYPCPNNTTIDKTNLSWLHFYCWLIMHGRSHECVAEINSLPICLSGKCYFYLMFGRFVACEKVETIRQRNPLIITPQWTEQMLVSSFIFRMRTSLQQSPWINITTGNGVKWSIFGLGWAVSRLFETQLWFWIKPRDKE